MKRIAAAQAMSLLQAHGVRSDTGVAPRYRLRAQLTPPRARSCSLSCAQLAMRLLLCALLPGTQSGHASAQQRM
eukprot:CAMPEP_0119299506 /NCGR_PEP_ID=MMETSP1333-20130426/1586_1 /TAXON_ID=418940 /ORGANISM="Scyphosphaera apsteinii, Strain RCC1455" /LENGTH=73 /DNA_ID=CAMNT_0007300957 /DNA_START=839 /DNA_END=1060 /DNA_ORIENTATION=-